MFFWSCFICSDSVLEITQEEICWTWQLLLRRLVQLSSLTHIELKTFSLKLHLSSREGSLHWRGLPLLPMLSCYGQKKWLSYVLVWKLQAMVSQKIVKIFLKGIFQSCTALIIPSAVYKNLSQNKSKFI